MQLVQYITGQLQTMLCGIITSAMSAIFVSYLLQGFNLNFMLPQHILHDVNDTLILNLFMTSVAWLHAHQYYGT